MSTHPSNKITNDNVRNAVRYHAPTPDQAISHELLAQETEKFIMAILTAAPDCADRSTAIRCAREAKMWASAAIALEPKP